MDGRARRIERRHKRRKPLRSDSKTSPLVVALTSVGLVSGFGAANVYTWHRSTLRCLVPIVRRCEGVRCVMPRGEPARPVDESDARCDMWKKAGGRGVRAPSRPLLPRGASDQWSVSCCPRSGRRPSLCLNETQVRILRKKPVAVPRDAEKMQRTWMAARPCQGRLAMGPEEGSCPEVLGRR